MRIRVLSTALAALALGVAPMPALAQSAGDDQYQDPLAAPSEPAAPQQEEPATPEASTPAPAPAPEAEPAAAADDAGASAGAAAELPRTGLPAGLVGLAGAALAGAGVALRRRT